MTAIQKAREALVAARDTLSAASRQLTDDHKIVLGGKRWGETAIAKIGAALAALDAETEGWRTMDSAPKDGTIVNVVARYPDAERGFPRYAGFNEEMGCWVEYSRHLPEPVVPLVWRPRGEWPQFSEARS